jgi:hypothetical protein
MTDLPDLAKPAQPDVEDLRELLERARQGDRDALPRLREVLDNCPQLWQHFGDLGRHAEAAWIELVGGQDLYLKESLERKAAAMKVELAGSDPTPLERLLVERIVSCWLQFAHADAVLAQVKDLSLKQAEFASKRQDRAHRRYLMAIGTLATVRRLLPADREPVADVDDLRQTHHGSRPRLHLG